MRPPGVDLFWGTRGPLNAEIVVVGEAWGGEEHEAQKPFVGGAGSVLDSILRDAGIDPNTVLYTNVISQRPVGNDFSQFLIPGPGTVGGLNPGPDLIEGLGVLYTQLNVVAPQLIIACGNVPLWALTDCARISPGTTRGPNPRPNLPVGIADYHGSQEWRLVSRTKFLPPGTSFASTINANLTHTTTPVLPIYHPAYIMRDWAVRHTTVHDLRMRVPLALADNWDGPLRLYGAPPDFNQILKTLGSWLSTQTKLTLSLDIETKYNNHVLTCIGFSALANTAISIPFVNLKPDGSLESYWLPDQEKTILRLLSALFRHPNIFFIGQNMNFDMQVLWGLMRVKPKVLFDTMIVQNLLFPGTPKDLGTLSAMYCPHHKYWKDDNHEWAEGGTLGQHLHYNCEDVDRTLQIFQAQVELLHDERLGSKAKLLPIEMFKLELAREMNRNGIRRDKQTVQETMVSILEQMNSIAVRLSRMVPQTWVPTKSKVPWYRSDSQLKWVLYDLCQLPVQINRKTKKPASDKEALEALATKYPKLRKLFTMLLDYSSLDTIYTTFVKAKEEADGKIHGSFNPAGTDTMRYSSQKNAFGRAHNMQNIPVGGDD